MSSDFRPENSGFPVGLLTGEQWTLVEALGKQVDAEQASWVSAYFATLAQARNGAGTVGSSGLSVTILFATETGNSEYVANAVAQDARAKNLSPTVIDLGHYDVARLADEEIILAVVSTTGEGDVPYAANGFFEDLVQAEELDLSNIRFSVLALGDSTYAEFCRAGKIFDRELERLGATRFSPRVDCDIDYEDSVAEWSATVLDLLSNAVSPTVSVSAPAMLPVVHAGGQAAGYDKRHPVEAVVIDNHVLTGTGSSKETRHIALRLPDSGPDYVPGDAVGLLVRNDPEVVADLLSALALDADRHVSVKGVDARLGTALEQRFEVAVATPRFLEQWAGLSGSSDLARLLLDEYRSERIDFLHRHHIIDIVRHYPVKGVDPQEIIDGLRPLQPRLYSIASSSKRHPGEVHITLGTVRYMLHGTARIGVASGLLGSSGAESRLSVFIQRNEHFRLPVANEPIIMIGAGTGVAPYRAYMEEREACGVRSPAWLFFGERNRATDFLYEKDWNIFLASQSLTRLDAAFSRDGGSKVYVQHRMAEHGADLFRWMEEGAHIYVCGDAKALAPDVHAMLFAIVQSAGNMSAARAEDYIRNLQDTHRYHRDVY